MVGYQASDAAAMAAWRREKAAPASSALRLPRSLRLPGQRAGVVDAPMGVADISLKRGAIALLEESHDFRMLVVGLVVLMFFLLLPLLGLLSSHGLFIS